MFCMECGAELPQNAKFCYNCGAKVSLSAAPASVSRAAGSPGAPSVPGASAPAAEKEAEGASLAQLFSSFDPVVCHSEYYYLNNGNPMLSGLSMAVNGRWILKHISHFPDDEYLLIDENGENTTRLDVRPKLRKSEYKNLMGFNSLGVWFFVRSQFNERFLNERFICVDVVRNRIYEYPIEHKHGAISDVYIYGDEVYYVNDTADFKQYLHRVLPSGGTELFSTQIKAERIFRLSATAKTAAWGYTSNREGKECWYWYFFDKASGQRAQLTAPRHPDRTSQPLIELVAPDVSKGTLYTALSENEAGHFNIAQNSIATRKLADPVEFQILSYKDGQNAIWRVPREGGYYFDGSVYYQVVDNGELDRYDRFGAKYILGRTGKGACGNFLVTDKWLFINFDAHDMVRLPKAFCESKGSSEEDPEVFYIFGRGQDFRM